MLEDMYNIRERLYILGVDSDELAKRLRNVFSPLDPFLIF
jgi:hypothetical protein